MKAFRTLYRANLTEFLSNRRALFLTIAFPVLFITIFGLVFTNQDKADARVGVACVTPNDELTKAIVKALQDVTHRDMDGDGTINQKDAEKNPFSELQFVTGDEQAMKADVRRGRLDAVIVIPPDLGTKAEEAKIRALKAAVEEQRDMDDLAGMTDDEDESNGKPAKEAATPVPNGSVAAPVPRATPTPNASPALDGAASAKAAASLILTIDPSRQMLIPILQGILGKVLDGVDAEVTGQPRLLDIEVQATTAREVRTIDYLLPGILAMSIMQLGLFATAQPLVALRTQGVLKRLNATPLSRTTLLCAYIAFRLTVAMFQTGLCVLIGRYAFKVAVVGNWGAFAGWLLLGTLVFLSIGFFMAAVSKNEESCIAIGNIINLPMILLSGVFFPVNHLSRVFDYIIPLVPLNYLGDALRQTMVDAVPIHSLATNAMVLGVWVVIMTVLSVSFFRWESR